MFTCMTLCKLYSSMVMHIPLSTLIVVCTPVVMAAVFVYTIMMNAILLLYTCCDHTVMKGILVSIIIIIIIYSCYYQCHCVKYSLPCITCTVEGRVATTLPEVATVCNGSQLELNCTIIGSILEWRIIPEQNHSQLSAMTHYPTRNQSFHYGESTVTFTIISHPMELTLYRTVISPVTNSLNGTEVECTNFEDQESSSSTVIKIVNDQGSVIYKISIHNNNYNNYYNHVH